MLPELKSRIEELLGRMVESTSPVSGGCIAEAFRIELSNGGQIFGKTAPGKGGMFPREANGLKELNLSGSIRVPEVLHADDELLLIEWVDTGPRPSDFEERFGRAFAGMHRASQRDSCGFFEDNYIGSTPQINSPQRPAVEWAEFYWEQRLKYQIDRASSKGHATPELLRLAGRLEERLPELLAGSEENACVLHGDLWSGNYLVDSEGAPVLIDPAVYYGHREADLGMCRLFGGFSSGFYEAYHEAWPLPAGDREREGLYMLYHVLNHLNLFGSSYYAQSLSLLKQYR